MWSSVSKQIEKLAKKGGSAVALVGRRAPKFGVDGTGGGSGLPQRVALVPQPPKGLKKRQQAQRPAGNGKQQRGSQKDEGFAEPPKPVIMAAAAKVAKRVPLIRFPNRKAGEKQGAVAVNRAVGSGGQSQAMPSLPSGTASSQPPRTKLTDAEIESVLLGGAAP